MLPTVDGLTRTAASILGSLPPDIADAQRVCDSRKVSDHHAIVPTPSAGTADLSALPMPEQHILKLICRNLLEATSPAHRFEEVVITLDCAGTQFTAKGKRILVAIQSGTQEPESFLEGICTMLQEMFMEYTPVKGAEVLFPSTENIMGSCPRCGRAVIERSKGFFCTGQDCKFVLWRNNRFFTAKKKEITPRIAASFLEKREALLQGCYSEKTGKSYDAKAVMEDDGCKTNFRLVFAHE